MTRRHLLGLLLTAPALALETPQQVLENLKTWQRASAGQPENLEAGRRYFAGTPLPDTPEVKGRWENLGGLLLRILTPKRSRGLLLQLHGGGWCLGSLTSGEDRLRILAEESRLTVVSPDYRLAPEHPYPAAVEDCLKAADWVLGQGRPAFLMGSSAGAHLAALVLTQRQGFRRAVLYYGVYDLSRTPSWRLARDEDHPDLQPSALVRFVERFAGGQDLRSPALSPLYANLEGVPPALFLVGEKDILVDDSRFLASRWPASELVVYREGFHGFDGYDLAMAGEARQKVTDWLRRE